MNNSGTELSGIMSLYADLGDTHHRVDSDPLPAGRGVTGDLVGVVCGDSSAAIASSQREGCGKLRHIGIGQFCGFRSA